jgi:hypothetical protein
MRVVDPERVGVIRLVETGETNLRAAVIANPIRPRDALLKVASLPKMLKPDIVEEATSESTRRAFRGGWGQRAGKDQSRTLGDPAGGAGNRANAPRESITEGTALAGSRRGS